MINEMDNQVCFSNEYKGTGDYNENRDNIVIGKVSSRGQ